MTPVKAGSLDVTGDQSGNLIKVMLYIFFIFFQQQPGMKQTQHPGGGGLPYETDGDARRKF